MSDISAWQGKWIWTGDEDAPKVGEHEIVYFRKTFRIDNPEDCKLIVQISADSCYRLYLNGESVCSGPCKGDRYTHYFETVDLSKYLVNGTNVIGVKVLHYTICEPFKAGLSGPASVWRSNSGAFIFNGVVKTLNGDEIGNLKSDDTWKCHRDKGIKFHPGELERLYVGGWERVEGTLIPLGWQMRDYDDRCWERAETIADVMNLYGGELNPWVLEPSPIPIQYEKHMGFAQVKRSFNENEEPNFYSYIEEPLKEGYKISSNRKFVMELDAGELLTGYPFIEISGGQGSTIKILYSECYEDTPDSMGKRKKGIRDEAENRVLFGEWDIYKTAGIGSEKDSACEHYEPFSFRTFRYIRLEIETWDEPLNILRFNFRETGYPLEVKADFQSSDQTMAPLWNISINTLKRCMHQTYEDCPYYEQFQYIMDTYLEAAFTYRLSGDDRLARKAIFDFHSSALPNGMLQSRYPSICPQIIPGFSLYWILMVYDHYCYYADLSLVRRYLPTIDAVLGWFDRHVNAAGLIGQMPENYWSFVDWADEWQDSQGVPTANKYGPITIYSMFYITALQAAAALNDESGRTSTADEYRQRAKRIKCAVKKHCWSSMKKLFMDGPGVEKYSQHTQIWAVLSDVVEGEEAVQLMERMLEIKGLTKASYSMSFFLFRALSKTKRYEKAFKLFDVWKQLASLNLTTWVEDPVSQRSDCHGWGAVPIYEFTSEILGIKPKGYGFQSMIISPQLGNLSWAKGSLATPFGLVCVEWKLTKEDLFCIKISTPSSTIAELELPNGKCIKLKGGEQHEVVEVLRERNLHKKI